MPALDSSQVHIAITGGLYVASEGSTAPTDATSPVPTGFNGVGYISEDGVTEAFDDNSDDITAWQNGATVRTVISSSTATLQAKIIQLNKTSLELYYKGSTVTSISGGGSQLDVKVPNADRRAFIFDVIDGDNHYRTYIPHGEVTSRGDIAYVSTDAIGLDVTITAYPDENNVVFSKFTDDSAWAAS